MIIYDDAIQVLAINSGGSYSVQCSTIISSVDNSRLSTFDALLLKITS